MDTDLRLQCLLIVCQKEYYYRGGCPTDDSECEITRSVKPLCRIKETLRGVKIWLTCVQPLLFFWDCFFGSVLHRRPLLRMDRLLTT